MSNRAEIPGIVGAKTPPPLPTPISLPRAWVDVLLHSKSERFRQWFPWVSPRWMRLSFLAFLVLVVAEAAERAALVFIWLGRPDDAPHVPLAVVTFIVYIVASVGTFFAMALGVALLMDRAYGPLRIRLGEYVLRTWLLAQPGIGLVLLLGYPLVAWLAIVNLYASSLPSFTIMFVYAFLLFPLWYSLGLGSEAMAAASGRTRFSVTYLVLLPIGLVYFVLTWTLPEYATIWLSSIFTWR